jgi:hypothetical protein
VNTLNVGIEVSKGVRSGSATGCCQPEADNINPQERPANGLATNAARLLAGTPETSRGSS